MAKTRLNNRIREEITKFLELNLDALCPKETRAKVDAYHLARKLVEEDRLKKWPEKDMRVLRKYGLTRKERDISGVNPDGRQITMVLEPEHGIERPDIWKSVIHPFRDETAKAIDAYELAKDKWEKARRDARQDYDALIAAYRYIDDVIEVWPATSAVLDGYLKAANRDLPVALPEAALRKISKRNLGAPAA